MRIGVLALLLVCVSAAGWGQSGAHWDYYGKTGPLGWARLDPAYRVCSQGKEQSPIDIRGAHLNKSLQPIEFHYRGASTELENTGNGIVVHVKPGSYIVADGVRYDLVFYDFHHPAEEAVNGKLTDMDIQLLHKSADGKLAILAVRLSQDMGDANATLAALWEHLPTTPGTKQTDPDMVNPGGLLPADRGYWTYMGSLTTPPCTEGVRWFVFEQPISVSRMQLRAFAALYRINSRPLQDRNGRKIEANE